MTDGLADTVGILEIDGALDGTGVVGAMEGAAEATSDG